jgi:hypothetical protein
LRPIARPWGGKSVFSTQVMTSIPSDRDRRH